LWMDRVCMRMRGHPLADMSIQTAKLEMASQEDFGTAIPLRLFNVLANALKLGRECRVASAVKCMSL